MIIHIGDEPVTVHGTYCVHVFSPGAGDASLENTHFIDEPASWQPIIQLGAVDTNAGVTIELAGSARLVGSDPTAKASLVQVFGRHRG